MSDGSITSVTGVSRLSRLRKSAELIFTCRESGMEAFLVRGLTKDRKDAEQEILSGGEHLPLCHRLEWAENLCVWEPWFVFVRDASGQACGGVAIERVRCRTLPGCVVLRVKRFGENLSFDVCKVALNAIAILAKKSPRVLRLHVHVFSREGREAIAKVLDELGLKEISPPSSYRYTLAIDLRQSEEEILASFNRNARRRIRESMDMSLRSCTLTDPIYAERLQELQQGALQRTGGHIASRDWRGVLTLSRNRPNLSCVIGIFAGESTAPQDMGAFGWACSNGDHVEYCAAGTQRSDQGTPFGYLLAWDIIRWAKTTGADWFDMGGVTLEGDASPLEGISRFKRYFSREVVEVGAEWILEPAPLLAKTQTMITSFRQRFAG
jgi:hypothetical protein